MKKYLCVGSINYMLYDKGQNSKWRYETMKKEKYLNAIKWENVNKR